MRLSTTALLTASFVTLTGTVSATQIASDNFDSPLNLTSYSAIDAEGNDPTNTGVWSSPSDNFGPRNVNDYSATATNFLSDAAIDRSNTSSGAGDVGIVTFAYPDGNFFSIVDTDNGANDSGGVTGTWVFDISSAQSLTEFSVDAGAIGTWFDNGSAFEQFYFFYSIDGGAEEKLITFRGYNGQPAVNLTMVDGATTATSNVLVAGTTNYLTNNLQTFTAPLAGSGSELTLSLYGFINGNASALVLDNISINGVVPEPGSFALLGLGGLLVARRRR